MDKDTEDAVKSIGLGVLGYAVFAGLIYAVSPWAFEKLSWGHLILLLISIGQAYNLKMKGKF
jgi:hypothetical protein